MNDERDLPPWPPEAGDPRSLPEAVAPPPDLEDRVVAELAQRGAIASGRRRERWRPLWTIAAGVALLVAGYLAGRVAGVSAEFQGTQADYALLLFETEGYDAPADSGERVERYQEYSRWVAEARGRGQFVTGEDLAVDRGFVVEPADGAPRAQPGVAVAGAPALSGIFLIKADDDEHALELARRLPHVRHGGRVVVQRTIPTDSPPSAAEAPEAIGGDAQVVVATSRLSTNARNSSRTRR